jgi:hypothetical protein
MQGCRDMGGRQAPMRSDHQRQGQRCVHSADITLSTAIMFLSAARGIFVSSKAQITRQALIQPMPRHPLALMLQVQRHWALHVPRRQSLSGGCVHSGPVPLPHTGGSKKEVHEHATALHAEHRA